MGLLERSLCYSYLLALDFNSYFLNFSVGHLRFGNFKLWESINPNFTYFANLFLSPSSLHLNLIFSILQ